jgi:hypothetical protein
VSKLLSAFSHTECHVLRYTVAGGVSITSNTQAMCDAEKILPTKDLILSDSCGVCLASGRDLLNTLMTYTATCVLTCGDGSDITFDMLLPTPG